MQETTQQELRLLHRNDSDRWIDVTAYSSGCAHFRFSNDEIDPEVRRAFGIEPEQVRELVKTLRRPVPLPVKRIKLWEETANPRVMLQYATSAESVLQRWFAVYWINADGTELSALHPIDDVDCNNLIRLLAEHAAAGTCEESNPVPKFGL